MLVNSPVLNIHNNIVYMIYIMYICDYVIYKMNYYEYSSCQKKKSNRPG